MCKLINTIKKNTINIPGWYTSRKIIVFESDDWGSIRMRSKETRDHLEKKGFNFQNQHYNRYDSLESNQDIESLFEILYKFKDKNQSHPVFTAVSIVGNPDFQKIKESGFQAYFWESFTKTLEKYPHHNKVYDLYKEGICERLFVPVFHGREHINVQRWMRKLQNQNASLLFAFDNEVTGISRGVNNEILGNFQAAFDIDFISDLIYLEKAIKEGISEFIKLWGYQPRYFVPPNGPFNNRLEATLKECDINYILAERVQKEPIGEGKYKTHFHYLGLNNQYNQIYLTRNAFFEPVIDKNAVEHCLKDIANAFQWKKPAIISSHRVNYIGFIDEMNRIRNLNYLNQLLAAILKKWPDVEFMTSVEMGDLIKKSK